MEDKQKSFDHLDGETQPKGLVKTIYEGLLGSAQKDMRTSQALVAHNYQRLLAKIDLNHDGKYSSEEYRRAIHNPSYRDVLYKMIAKHPSDWYYKKEADIWGSYLNKLKKDAPDWKEYSEGFIDKMAWMQEVTTEKLGPSLWHMHPIMFLNSFFQEKQKSIIFPLKVKPENDPEKNGVILITGVQQKRLMQQQWIILVLEDVNMQHEIFIPILIHPLWLFALEPFWKLRAFIIRQIK